MRKLVTRTLSGVGFLVVVIGCLLLSHATYALLFAFVLAVCCCEYYRMTVPGRYRTEKVLVIIAALAFFLLSYCVCAFSLDVKFVALALLPAMAAFIAMLHDCSADYDFNAHLFFPLLYVALPVSSTLLLTFGRGGEYSPVLILSVFAMIWFNDVGAYVFGMGFGQKPDSRKLSPALSPKKSWWGVGGGTVATLLAAVGAWAIAGRDVMPLCHFLAVGLIVAVFGVCGDLFESLIKRHAGVKDAGNIIPGHGGMLDRFDDVLFLMPLVAIYLLMFNLV